MIIPFMSSFRTHFNAISFSKFRKHSCFSLHVHAIEHEHQYFKKSVDYYKDECDLHFKDEQLEVVGASGTFL